MIKKEWITEKNGFVPGQMVLYIDPTQVTFSQVFRLKDLEAEEAFHPGADGGKRPLVKVHGASHTSPYANDWFLEYDGDLYPLESPLYSLWHPSRPETRDFHTAIIQRTELGHNDGVNRQISASKQEVLYTNSGNDVGWGRSKGFAVYDRPDWATK